jgi:predicted transcriptional regulator
MDTKNEQVGFRLSSDLKKELQDVARRERRTLSQVCEIFLTGGLEAYKREGAKYLQRLLSRLKKEPSE